jgi:prevent-host-death family protein
MALTFPLTVARTRLGELVSRARFGQEPVILTEHGREVAAIISVEELADLRSAAAAADLRTAQAIASDGDPGVPHEQLMAALDALDATDDASSPAEATRLLTPHAELLALLREDGAEQQ